MDGENDEQAKSFEELGVCKELAEACDSLGWKNPSKIQTEAIPHALEGKDLIGLAKTGSGKTGAFALPILQALLQAPHAFFACVLSPTRELAIQIAEQFEALGSGIGVKCAVLVGGVQQVPQTIAIGKRPHIIVATPGRLVDHLSSTKGFSLRTLKYLVIPAIKAKWPPNASKHIIIQWDNAPPHIKNDDPDFRAAASADGFDIQLQFQPPNSPDTNINDLGWFASLDAVKTESSNKSVEELVKAVLTAYAELSEKKLDKLFLSLQNVMISMMTVRGHNNYKLPHLGKDKLERDGKLRRNLKVDIKLVRECIQYLQQIGIKSGFEGIVAQLEEQHLL